MFGRICSRFSSFPGKYLEHVQELARNYSGIKVYSWRKQAASQFTNSQNNSHSHHTCFFWNYPGLFDFSTFGVTCIQRDQSLTCLVCCKMIDKQRQAEIGYWWQTHRSKRCHSSSLPRTFCLWHQACLDLKSNQLKSWFLAIKANVLIDVSRLQSDHSTQCQQAEGKQPRDFFSSPGLAPSICVSICSVTLVSDPSGSHWCLQLKIV